MTERSHISALAAISACWDEDAIHRQVPEKRRQRVVDEAIAWQSLGGEGSNAEMWAQPMPMRREKRVNGRVVRLPRRGKKPPREPNRILEIMGLMGGMGEQLSLAWTFEQDAQRFVATAASREAEHQLLIQRALCESSGHFILGATHSLGNLVLRLLLLNNDAAVHLAGTKPYRRSNGFRPTADDRFSWLTLNGDLVGLLQPAAAAGTNRFMTQAVDVVATLLASTGFQDLDARRGMDYHRRRPQSVQHASPRREVVTISGGTRTMTMFAATLDPEANADRVHEIVVTALEELHRAMRSFRALLGRAIRAEGIAYIES